MSSEFLPLPALAQGHTLHIGAWEALKPAARSVRHAVFVVEQNIPIALEWDDWDAQAVHAVVLGDAGEPLATGRLLPPAFDPLAPTLGHIGRMAVVASARRAGLGGAILRALMARAPDHGFTTILLHAQSYVAPFYACHGFVAQGSEFMEAGIAHVAMRAPLPPQAASAYSPLPTGVSRSGRPPA